MATATRTAPYKNYEKYSPFAVHLRRRSIGANLDDDGNVRIYRAPDSSLTAAKNIGLVIEQADTTNNPDALVIKNSGTGVGINLVDVAAGGAALSATLGDAANVSITGSIKIKDHLGADMYIPTTNALA